MTLMILVILMTMLTSIRNNEETLENASAIREIGGNGTLLPENRQKRQSNYDLYLEMAFFIDNGFWNNYVERYGDRAETEIYRIINLSLETMQSDVDYLTDNRLKLNVNKMEIWKTQPKLELADYWDELGNGHRHTQVLWLLGGPYNPQRQDVDQTTLFTGYDFGRFWGGNGAMWGPPMYGPMCKDPKNTIMIITDMQMPAIGKQCSHELGHNFGISHDGPQDPKADLEHECDPKGTLMGTGGGLFSECSKKRFQYLLAKSKADNKNCLSNKPKQTADMSENHPPSPDLGPNSTPSPVKEPCRKDYSVEYCESIKDHNLCNDEEFIESMKYSCPRTCGFCSG